MAHWTRKSSSLQIRSIMCSVGP